MKRIFFKQFISILCSVFLIGSTFSYTSKASAQNSNLVSNSTFDNDVTDWSVYYQSGGVCNIYQDKGRLALNISSVGTLSYSVQLYYDVIPLYKNGVYRIKYDISSTINRTIDGMIQQNGGTYQTYTSEKLTLTDKTQTIDYEFTMNSESDIMSRLVFNCGYQGEDLPKHTIYLDNVSIELIDDSNVDYSSFRNYEPPIVTNQIGYKTNSVKTAVFKNAGNETSFCIKNADTGKTVYTGLLNDETFNEFAGEKIRTGDFSGVTQPGRYYITCGSLDNSYIFEISDTVYSSAFDDSIRMLYLQRCGTKVEDNTFGHDSCHNSLAVVYGTNEKVNVSGGWHDAGDYGRYVVSGAKTVADLLYAYQNAPEQFTDNIGIPESKNGIPDVLDEARYEIEWLLKMQDSSGGVHHKVTCESFPGYVMPDEETEKLILTPISTTATADFCGVMALAYEVYKDIDSEFAEKCLSAAKYADDFLNENPYLIFKNPPDIVTGEYGDSSDVDERYWAKAQMWRSTGDEKYLKQLESMKPCTGLDTANFGDYGNIAIVNMSNIDKNSAVYTRAKNSIIANANLLVKNADNSPYGLTVTQYYKNGWGSNMTAANHGIILGNAYLLTGDEKYLNTASSNLNYLMGCNPLGVCYFTGYGTISPQHPHHRPSIAMNKSMSGMLVGGVHPYLEDSAAKAYCSGQPTGKCYIDNQESYSTNEITIYWNSPLTYLFTFINSQETITGDVNTDGQFNIADVIMIQKYLLGKEDLINWKAGDLNKDNVINIFDLCLMKRKINVTF